MNKPIGVGAIAAFALALLCAACAGDSKPPPEFARGFPLSELNAQELRGGECAAVIWTTGQTPERIAMLYTQPPRAEVVLWGRQESFERISASGEQKLGLPARQSFRKLGVTLDFDLQFRQLNELSDGALVQSGSLTYADANGWSIVTAVAGVLACAPKG